MQDIFDLIAAVRAGQVWTAVRLIIKLLAEWQQYLPVDGQPVMSVHSSDDTTETLLAELELHTAQPTNTVGATAIPWQVIVPILKALLLKLLS